jgi:hypothetical protein
VFAHTNYLHPSLIFASKAWTYNNGATTGKGKLHALSSNNGLVWGCTRVTNLRVYSTAENNYERKKFYRFWLLHSQSLKDSPVQKMKKKSASSFRRKTFRRLTFDRQSKKKIFVDQFCQLTKWLGVLLYWSNVCHLNVSQPNVCWSNVCSKCLSANCLLAIFLWQNVCQLNVCHLHVCWQNVSLPNICWPNVCWQNVCWQNVCWPNVCWPNVCWPNVCQPNVLSKCLST